LLTCTFISLISRGSGRTSNEFQPCSKPCPLAAKHKSLLQRADGWNFICGSLFSFFGAWHLIAVCFFCRRFDGWLSEYFYSFLSSNIFFGWQASSLALPLTKGLAKYGQTVGYPGFANTIVLQLWAWPFFNKLYSQNLVFVF
jgi:hypothetical protein